MTAEQLERDLREVLPMLMARPDVTADQVITLVMRCARPLLGGEEPPPQACRRQDEPDSACW